MKTTNLICSFSQIDYNLHFNYMLWSLLNPTFQIHWMRCHLYVCSEITLISCDWHALPPPFMPGKLLLTSQTPSQLSSFETITSFSTLASIALNVSAANIFLSCLHPQWSEGFWTRDYVCIRLKLLRTKIYLAHVWHSVYFCGMSWIMIKSPFI